VEVCLVLFFGVFKSVCKKTTLPLYAVYATKPQFYAGDMQKNRGFMHQNYNARKYVFSCFFGCFLGSAVVYSFQREDMTFRNNY